MANSIVQKLKVRENYTLLTLHAPGNFEEHLGALPEGVKIVTQAKGYNQIHWFVFDKAQLEKELDKVLKLLKDDVLCWTYYPKGTSKIQTDLTRDKGWEGLLAHSELQWISLISFDDTWSTFGFRLKQEADRKREEKPRVREIFDYIDQAKKEVRLPEDLSSSLKKHQAEAEFFNTLSFSNKKEYVEWILTARREETRKQRIEGTIERLAKGWKNPRNM